MVRSERVEPTDPRVGLDWTPDGRAVSAARYRVEHWHGEEVDVLGEGTAVDDFRAILAAYIAQLPSGASGAVVVVDQVSGVMIAWQALWRGA